MSSLFAGAQNDAHIFVFFCAQAVEYATAAIEAANGLSRAAAAFMPLVFAMSHLLPVAIDIVRTTIRGRAAEAPPVLGAKAEALVDAGATTAIRCWTIPSAST